MIGFTNQSCLCIQYYSVIRRKRATGTHCAHGSRKHYAEWKGARHRALCGVRFHLYDILGKPELQWQKRDRRLPGGGAEEGVYRRTFLGDGDVLYIDFCDDYMTPYTCQNVQRSLLKRISFILYKSYLSKPDFKKTMSSFYHPEW